MFRILFQKNIDLFLFKIRWIRIEWIQCYALSNRYYYYRVLCITEQYNSRANCERSGNTIVEREDLFVGGRGRNCETRLRLNGPQLVIFRSSISSGHSLFTISITRCISPTSQMHGGRHILENLAKTVNWKD